jgi:hypothetical protein
VLEEQRRVCGDDHTVPANFDHLAQMTVLQQCLVRLSSRNEAVV